ncbi:cation diffusion facilitator family transporter [Paenibacillus larvae]|uniref:CDF family cation diffusion facilitator n=4 Tax=Paenibacillus larvae TaxID=1464 RepID=V9W6B4_9BACL|nr:cation diffusion facilitator family transporter [Paenibacillus larvae]AHD05688.1 CDF family cation diffusion facilitator [Paenibacillus larvae subsp. larvae DSM 25430]AQR76831.1 cation-efflux pump [Paenibacillus larvae subsp. larvae]AQZ48525.1 cation-efflux pump [Paenibacillus larvae subsp. pulvifaciens]ARF70254.1 cation-efflux pump [Paenibacillus larvae subsp. pulvifaciens]AVF22272.1 CDF family cation diffusion facilitator [Paenibacillus larvae subsp. larvae]
MNNLSSLLALWISLISNVVLTALKIVVGYLFNSQVLIADGIHNAGDVIATFAALTSSMVSKKPADADHPYGHGKAEVIASAIVAIILAMAAVLMVFKSVEVLFEPAAEASIIALIAAFISLIWKQGLYIYCIRLGKTQRSKSLTATANDHLADVYASTAAVAGIGATLIGERYGIPFTQYGDPIAGMIVSYFVLKLAYEMGKESIGILMEKNLPSEQLIQLEDIVRSIPQVKRIDRIRAREHGHYILVDIRVSISNDLTIQEGHDISRLIKNSIKNQIQDVEEVMVHLNPWYEENVTS